MNLREVGSVDAACNLLADQHTRLFFSQMGEDAVLYALLENYGKLRQRGFYVDVGALHPSQGSNTKMLHLLGWWGINIDANPAAVELFRAARPNDINIHAVVADEPSVVQFDVFNVPALSSAHPENRARSLATGGVALVESLSLQTRRLGDILSESVPPGQTVDFLQVDAEGYDLSVLKSNDWTRFAPFFLMVEDGALSLLDRPNTEVHRYLSSLGYRLASVAFVTSIYVRDQV